MSYLDRKMIARREKRSDKKVRFQPCSTKIRNIKNRICHHINSKRNLNLSKSFRKRKIILKQLLWINWELILMVKSQLQNTKSQNRTEIANHASIKRKLSQRMSAKRETVLVKEAKWEMINHHYLWLTVKRDIMIVKEQWLRREFIMLIFPLANPKLISLQQVNIAHRLN